MSALGLEVTLPNATGGQSGNSESQRRTRKQAPQDSGESSNCLALMSTQDTVRIRVSVSRSAYFAKQPSAEYPICATRIYRTTLRLCLEPQTIRGLLLIVVTQLGLPARMQQVHRTFVEMPGYVHIISPGLSLPT